MREDHIQAETFLKDSLKAYKDFLVEREEDGSRKTAYGLRDLLKMNAPDHSSSKDNDKILDLMNAYTYYLPRPSLSEALNAAEVGGMLPHDAPEAT